MKIAIEKIRWHISNWMSAHRAKCESVCVTERGHIYFIVQPKGNTPSEELEQSLALLTNEIAGDDECKALEFEAFSCVGPPEKYDNWMPSSEAVG